MTIEFCMPVTGAWSPYGLTLWYRLGHDLSQQPKYNSLELKIGRVIYINREYIDDLYVVDMKN